MTRSIARGFGRYMPVALAAAIALGLPAAAVADNFPDRPIKLIVPFGPGGPPDVAARIIGAYLSEHLGTVVVENHVGAGGTLAARAVAGSPPDGYTLLAATAGSLAISPQLYKDAGIDPVKDFAAVAMVVLGAAGGRDQPVDPGAQRQGTGRLRQGQSRQAQLRRGDRHAAAYVRRNVQAHHRRQYRVRALQDRVAGHHRRLGRADEYDLRRHHRDRAAHQIRRSARACRDQPDADSGNPRRADHGRARLSRHAAGFLAGHRGAGRHAAGHRRQDQQGRERGLGDAGTAKQAQAALAASRSRSRLRILPPSSPISTSAGAR